MIFFCLVDRKFLATSIIVNIDFFCFVVSCDCFFKNRYFVYTLFYFYFFNLCNFIRLFMALVVGSYFYIAGYIVLSFCVLLQQSSCSVSSLFTNACKTGPLHLLCHININGRTTEWNKQYRDHRSRRFKKHIIRCNK